MKQFPDNLLTVLPLQSQQLAKAKNSAIATLPTLLTASQLKQTMLVFLPVAVVTPRFLLPLAHTLQKYPLSLAYPAEDMLLQDDDGFSVIPADDDVVAGFDWQLRLVWEGLGTGRSRAAEGYEMLSPSLAHAVAMAYDTQQQIGSFDSTLHSKSSLYPYDHVEYALRTWLCGGSVLKTQCSHIALLAENLAAATTLQETNQHLVDQNVMNIARKWMQTAPIPKGQVNTYMEIVYAARFTSRLPVAVEGLVDPIAIGPVQSSAKLPGRLVCNDLQWFLKEVYPGLLADMPSVLEAYSQHLQTDFITSALSAGNKLHYSQHAPMEAVRQEMAELLAREERLWHFGTQTLHIAGTTIKQPYVAPPAPITKDNLEDIVSDHADRVRKEGLCEDVTYQNYCTAHVGQQGNVREFCDAHKAVYIFACPKTCGYCDHGKFCEDLYLRKCAAWAQEGKCDVDEPSYGPIKEICRKSCKVCTPDYLQTAPAAVPPMAAVVLKTVHTHTDAPKPIAPAVPIAPAAPAVAAGGQTDSVEVHIAHNDWLNGMLPDVPSPSACAIAHTADGRLLDRIQISTEQTQIKVFCGIYTIGKAHANNVAATRRTWAKKCDGFVAFSDTHDMQIPALKIEHEGPESYDNMWQKSRSIWKHIAAAYVEEFDFFLLGGDDMLYIIENLKAYLASAEIQSAVNEQNGLFLGRVFAPPNQIVFNSGGAGYVLDKKAVRILGQHLDDPKCFPHQVGFWEDVNIANCLKVNGIVPYDTRDALDRERFHPFNPGNHLDYRIPPKNPDWYPKYSPNLKIGYECCSADSVSFHYLKEKALDKVYGYLYNCPTRGKK